MNAPIARKPTVKTLSFAMVLLMLVLQAVIVLHYPVHLVEGSAQAGAVQAAPAGASQLPADPAHHHDHGDDSCPVCFVVKSFAGAVAVFAIFTRLFTQRRVVYLAAVILSRAAARDKPFHAQGPPAFA